jgi:hypothetical protein
MTTLTAGGGAHRFLQPSVEKAKEKDGAMFDIIQNNYMRDYVKMRQAQDREEFLDSKIKAVKPIFKNFVDNNTNILRRDAAKSKIQSFIDQEKEEEDIQKTILDQSKGVMQDDGVTPKYRCYDPEAVSKTKPIRAVEKLLGSTTTTHALHMSKTAGPKGFFGQNHLNDIENAR